MRIHEACPACDCEQAWLVTFKVTVLVDNAHSERQAMDKAAEIAIELDDWETWVEDIEKAEW